MREQTNIISYEKMAENVGVGGADLLAPLKNKKYKSFFEYAGDNVKKEFENKILSEAESLDEAKKISEEYLNAYLGKCAKLLRDKDKKGTYEYDSAFMQMWFFVEDYIYQHLHQTSPTYMQNYSIKDDMISDIKTYVLEHLHEYDGVHALSTFVKIQVNHAATEFKSDLQGTTTYYTKMNQAVAEATKEGDKSILEIAEETGYSQAQIKKVLSGQTGSGEVISLTDNTEISADFNTPEEMMIQNERKEELERALSVLSPLERYIVELRADGTKYKDMFAEIPAEIVDASGVLPNKANAEKIFNIAIAKILKKDGQLAAKMTVKTSLHDISFATKDTDVDFGIMFDETEPAVKTA